MFKYDSNELYYACIVTSNHFDRQYIRFYVKFKYYYIESCNMNLNDMIAVFAEFIYDDIDSDVYEMLDFLMEEPDRYTYYEIDKNTYKLDVGASIDALYVVFDAFCDKYTYDYFDEYLPNYDQTYLNTINDYLKTLPEYTEDANFVAMLYNVFVNNREQIVKKAFDMCEDMLYTGYSDSYYGEDKYVFDYNPGRRHYD